MRARYSYGGKTLASFIELTPRFLHGLHKDDVIQKFRHALQAVPGVSRVIDHPKGSKTQQGNPGDHYQETNFYVYSEENPGRGMEFELTRNDHAKALKLWDCSRPSEQWSLMVVQAPLLSLWLVAAAPRPGWAWSGTSRDLGTSCPNPWASAPALPGRAGGLY